MKGTKGKAKIKEDQQPAQTKAAASRKATQAKQQDSVVVDRNRDMQLLVENLRKEFKGDGEILLGNEYSNVFVLRRPTGITSLDIAIGGGFPAGGPSQIIGKDSTGKTFLANLAIANVQRRYGDQARIGLIMTEIPYDKAYAKYKCGVRIAYSEEEIAWGEAAHRRRYTPDELLYLRDQVGQFVYPRLPTAEQLLEAAAQMIESNLFQIILIDSLGALMTKAEDNANVGDKHWGGASGVLASFMHRVHAGLMRKDAYGRPNTTTVIFINQYRMQMDGQGQMQQAGGYAVRHGKLLDIGLEVGSPIYVDKDKADWRRAGKEINWQILKGKAGCHDGPKGSYPFYFGEYGWNFGVDYYADLVGQGLFYGLVQRDGSWYNLLDQNNQPVGVRGQGMANFSSALGEDPSRYVQLRKDVLHRAGVNFITHEDDRYSEAAA